MNSWHNILLWSSDLLGSKVIPFDEFVAMDEGVGKPEEKPGSYAIVARPSKKAKAGFPVMYNGISAAGEKAKKKGKFLGCKGRIILHHLNPKYRKKRSEKSKNLYRLLDDKDLPMVDIRGIQIVRFGWQHPLYLHFGKNLLTVIEEVQTHMFNSISLIVPKDRPRLFSTMLGCLKFDTDIHGVNRIEPIIETKWHTIPDHITADELKELREARLKESKQKKTIHDRRWVAGNREKVRQWDRHYYRRNTAKSNAKIKVYHKESREKVNLWHQDHRRARRRARGAKEKPRYSDEETLKLVDFIKGKTIEEILSFFC